MVCETGEVMVTTHFLDASFSIRGYRGGGYGKKKRRTEDRKHVSIELINRFGTKNITLTEEE